MKRDSKQRLFEVMGRLDKTFKPKLNEEAFRDKNFKFHEGDEVTFPKEGKQIDGVISDYDYHMMTWKPTYDIDYMQDGRKMTIIGVPEDKITLKKSGSEEEYQKRFNQNKMIRKMQGGLEEDVAGKKTFTINLWGEEDEVFFDFDTYANNDTMAVELVTTMGEPYATVSTNLPESEDLPDGEFFLKDWSENEPIAKALIDMGAIIPTGKSASSGFVTAKSYKINPEYL